MTYSLANAPALAYDLVRLPEGSQVLQVLRTALACGSDDLSALAVRHPGPHRAGRWAAVLHLGAQQPARGAAAAAGAAADLVRAGDAAGGTALVHRLERATLGDLAAVDRMLRHDVLDWTWLGGADLAVQDPEASEACDVLADAAAAAYCSDRLDPVTRRSMAAPFHAARLAVPGRTGHPGVDAALRVLGSLDAEGRERWREAVEHHRHGSAAWAPAMHEATEALDVVGRLHLSADAQLAAAETFLAAGFTTQDAAYGVWNAISGSIHAIASGDLLPAGSAHVLLRSWRRVHDVVPDDLS